MNTIWPLMEMKPLAILNVPNISKCKMSQICVLNNLIKRGQGLEGVVPNIDT